MIIDFTIDLYNEMLGKADVITEEREFGLVKEDGLWKIAEFDIDFLFEDN